MAVTLPSNSAFHVWDIAVGTQEVVAPPLADGQYTFGTGGKTLTAGTGDLGLLAMTDPSTDATQKWVVTRHADDGSYQVKSAGTGECIDVPYSSKTDGQAVGQYTCTGTDNQRWLVTKDGTSLVLKAKHSGPALTAATDGSVVQSADKGVTGQRWTATAD